MKRHFKETIIFYIVACALNAYFFPSDPAYISYKLHPYLFATILIGIRYGIWESLLSAMLGSGLLIWATIHQQEMLEMEMIYGLEHMVLPLLIIIMGILVGEITESRLKKIQYYRGALQKEVAANMAKTKENMGLEQSLLQLEKKMASHGLGIRDFSDKLTVMMGMERWTIYRYTTELLQRFLGVQASIALISSPDIYHQEWIASKGDLVDLEQIETYRQSPVYLKMISESRAISLTEIIGDFEPNESVENAIYYAGPILVDQGKIDGIFLITKIPFIQFNATNFRLFQVILNAASMVIQNKLVYQSLLDAAPYHPQWLVEREHYFYKHVKDLIPLVENGSILLTGYDFGTYASDDMKHGFFTLLAQLCIKTGARVGHLQNLNIFVLFHLERSAQDLEQELKRRYTSYGFSEGFARLKTVSTPLDASLMEREIGFWIHYCQKAYEGEP